MARRPAGTPSNPAVITRAPLSFEDEQRHRVRRYVLMMSLRFPALIFAAIAYGIWHNPWVSLGIIAFSIPLPWIAVVLANDGPPKPKSERDKYPYRHGVTLQDPAITDGRSGALPPAPPASDPPTDPTEPGEHES